MDKNSSIYKTVLLGVVSACAGLLLSAVNAVTAPVIADNALKQVQSTLENFFPNGEFTDVTDKYKTDETELIDGVYEAKDEGYVFTLHNTGYSSDGFKFAIAFDNDGNIVGYEGLSNSETAGKGDKLFKDDYANQVIGLTSTDSVPVISGATVTSKAVSAAVTEAESVSCTDNGDGAYGCKVTGFAGELTATIEIKDGKVVSVKDLKGDDDGDGVGDDWFTDTSSLEGVSSADEIDAMTGATVTSNAVKSMIQAALDSANATANACSDNGDGTFACKAKGFAGELTATIEVKDGKVVSVKDLKGDDWFEDASGLEGVSDASEIDDLSGATFTSEAVKTMINAALASSK